MIGSLPKPEEARAFLADPDPAKRTKLIDRLLERDEYADFWALKWGDLLRIKSEYPVRVWPRGVLTYHRWVRSSMAANKPYDQFVRELLTANGSDFQVGPANYYRAVQKREPQTYAEATAVLFLGARLDCARCHAHPTENWGLDDGLGMAAFFSKVAIKATQEWKEEIVFFNQHGGVWHPKLRDYVNPKFLGGEVLDMPRDQDPRPKFAEWLTSPQNPWFAKVMANRVWYWLLGRGIVHEPDDFRSTNPPSNPELLDYLTQEFVAHKFDVKHLFRLILNSKTYQLSSKPNDFNRGDTAHFSHYYVRRMGAEQLLDAVCQVTGTSDQFASWIPVPPTIMPPGSRAVQVFDGDIRNPLLDLFGRPLAGHALRVRAEAGGLGAAIAAPGQLGPFRGQGGRQPEPPAAAPGQQARSRDRRRTVPGHALAPAPAGGEAEDRWTTCRVRARRSRRNWRPTRRRPRTRWPRSARNCSRPAPPPTRRKKSPRRRKRPPPRPLRAATQATTAQTNAEQAAAAKRQQATDAKKDVDDLVQSQQEAGRGHSWRRSSRP